MQGGHGFHRESIIAKRNRARGVNQGSPLGGLLEAQQRAVTLGSAAVATRSRWGFVMNSREARRAAGILFFLCGVNASGCAGQLTRGESSETSTGAAPAPTGATASAGPKCAATPTQLVDFGSLAAAVHAAAIGAPPLVVDDTSIYFVFGNALMRVPVRGGSATTLLSLPISPGLIFQPQPVLTSTEVIVHYPPHSNSSNEQIVSVPIAGGDPTMVATSTGAVNGLVTHGPEIDFVDQARIESAPAAGGSVRQVAAATADGPVWLALVGSNLITTSSAQGGSVLSVPLDGGTPTTLATQQGGLAFPMPCGSDTCWWAGSDPPASETANPDGAPPAPVPGAIERLTANGTVTSFQAAAMWSLAFDGTSFFETELCDACDGYLIRIPVDGSPPVSMGSGSFVAVDDSCAYWSTLEGIFSASKAWQRR
jgi:hypothetical protein